MYLISLQRFQKISFENLRRGVEQPITLSPPANDETPDRSYAFNAIVITKHLEKKRHMAKRGQIKNIFGKFINYVSLVFSFWQTAGVRLVFKNVP